MSIETTPPEDDEEDGPGDAAPAGPSYNRCWKCGWARVKCDDKDCPGQKT